MTIRRVVPNLVCVDLAATRAFYVQLLGFVVVMDMGWIVTLASPANETAQISLTEGQPAPEGDQPVLTIEVADVDGVHAAAAGESHEVVLSLRTEDWGVQRFFVRDPDGRVVNVMSHPEPVEGEPP